MRILRHRLHAKEGEPASFIRSPNTGGQLDPKYLVIHFTAGRSAEGSVNWLTNPDARASAHLVIGRDGAVTQLVPFDRVAWHAGPSQWDGLVGMNQHSIGIELDNAGRLERKGGKWAAWFGTTYPDEELMVAAHKHETHECGWHLFPPAQLDATLEVCASLVKKYELRDVVGHDDISPGRKCDPGPAFPLESFRSRLFGRSEDHLPQFRTRTALNIRLGPGTEHDRLPQSPLSPGTRLEVLDEDGAWRFATVLDSDEEGAEVQGWVHSKFVERIG